MCTQQPLSDVTELSDGSAWLDEQCHTSTHRVSHSVVVLAVPLIWCVHMHPVGWEESVNTPGQWGSHVEAGVLSCVLAHWVCDLGARYAAGVSLMSYDTHMHVITMPSS